MRETSQAVLYRFDIWDICSAVWHIGSWDLRHYFVLIDGLCCWIVELGALASSPDTFVNFIWHSENKKTFVHCIQKRPIPLGYHRVITCCICSQDISWSYAYRIKYIWNIKIHLFFTSKSNTYPFITRIHVLFAHWCIACLWHFLGNPWKLFFVFWWILIRLFVWLWYYVIFFFIQIDFLFD